jgi:hypothetical protein
MNIILFGTVVRKKRFSDNLSRYENMKIPLIREAFYYKWRWREGARLKRNYYKDILPFDF